jgi:hypothetical protein
MAMIEGIAGCLCVLLAVGQPARGEADLLPRLAPAVARGEAFLASLFDPAVDLLPEYRGSRTYWLFHDNYLAAHVLAWSRLGLSARVRAALERHGARSSGKIEIVVDGDPGRLPFRVPELVTVAEVEGRTLRTERLTAPEEKQWRLYADLLLLAAIARASTEIDDARRDLDAALRLWDGQGFKDRVVEVAGHYATYKLALALIAAARAGAPLPMRREILQRLLALESSQGGWITDYAPGGKPRGLANVETTCLALIALAQEAALARIGRGEDRLAIHLRGEQVATFHFRDRDVKRPYFADLRAPGGFLVTRPHPPQPGRDPDDHAHFHPGAWLAFGSLGGADFWRAREGSVVELERFETEPWGREREGGFTAMLRYVSAGKELCRERSSVRVRAVDAGTLLELDSELRSSLPSIDLGDQQEMGFGVRLATPLLPANGGRLRDSAGRETARAIWGNEVEWCEAFAIVGARRVGVALFAHPENPRPSRAHVRDYGLMVLNPFGRKDFDKGEESRFPVRSDAPVRLRFALLVHAEDPAKPVDVSRMFAEYVAGR